jgi:uncharacterized protein (DUF433 family)
MDNKTREERIVTMFFAGLAIWEINATFPKLTTGEIEEVLRTELKKEKKEKP